MVFKGVPNWPPAWIWTSGIANTRPTGEIGTLLDVRQSTVNPDTCFISIAYDESTYDNVAIGSVRETYLIQEKRDRAVRKIFALLAGTESQIVGNRPRKKIGCLRNHADPPPQFLWRDLQIVSSFQINRAGLCVGLSGLWGSRDYGGRVEVALV